MKTVWRAGTALALLVSTVVACGSDDDDDSAPESSPASAASAVTTAAPGGATSAEPSATTAATSATTAASAGDSAAPAADSGDPYQVYAVIDQTGPLGPVYTPAAAGVRAFFEQLNEQGGVNGRRVELEVKDSQSTPDAAQALYRQAIDAEPIAIFNMSASTGVSAAAPLLVDSGIPVLGVGASDDLLYPQPAGNIYMLQPTSEQQITYGLGLVQRLTGGDLTGAKVAMVGLSPSSIIDAAYDKIRAALEAEGGEVVAVERPTSPIASFSTQAVVLSEAEPDAVFLSLAPSDAITVATALKDAGLDVPVIVLPSSGTDAPAVFEAINSENYYAVRFVRPPAETAQAALAGDEYANSAAWATGWMFGAIVAGGIEKCGADCDAARLNETLQTGGPIDLGDVTFAPVEFTENSHSAVSAVQYFVWDPAQSQPVPAGEVIDVDER